MPRIILVRRTRACENSLKQNTRVACLVTDRVVELCGKKNNIYKHTDPVVRKL